MNELLERWQEFKLTQEYKDALNLTTAAGMGMGFLGLGAPTDIFTTFMDWLGSLNEQEGK